MEAAQAKRDEGAALFSEKNYTRAETCFIDASNMVKRLGSATSDNEKNKILLSCYLNLASINVFNQKYSQAAEYATEALDVNKKSVKAYYRRGQAYRGMKEYSKARFDLMMASEIEPNNTEIRDELADLRKEIEANGGAPTPSRPVDAMAGYPSSIGSLRPPSAGLGGGGLGGGMALPPGMEQYASLLKYAPPPTNASTSTLTSSAPIPTSFPTNPTLQALLDRANGNDAEAMFTLAEAFENGKDAGCPVHKVASFTYYKKAAEVGGKPVAQAAVAWCYKTGFGVDRNDTEAVGWYIKAANQGYVKAQACLGFCYEKGEGAAKDMSKAVGWYAKAAEQGDNVAQVNLALCYEKGTGIAQDHRQAFQWFMKAAEQGNLNAIVNVGVAYEKGEGVEK
eukprot:PhF_6_TR26076/c0_g1_i3/m.36791/K07126/K07126; uncharacterized protein